ncbi:tuliposide A-converting enzyme 2, chloroplastic-like [Lolium rigidum]|uniref:tuliposide A-converting enzyme 2, chloroplastic-like n=1 Tax=Lolium rigidum TaxID=89674 RepID=UPI001F5C1D54|nr:tuliposide A-converting enzyme 2, chloroplastic-like [Lolium rigidum]
MDPNEEIEIDFRPFLVVYKSGRIQRFGSTSRKSAGTDAATGVTSKDVLIDAATGLAARLFLPEGVSGSQKLPVLVYAHGGGFVTESAFSARYTGYVNALVAAAGVVAVSVEYRLAPEHPIPAAYDDVLAALRWAAASCVPGGAEPWLADHGNSARLFVAGSSSGGNVAHNVVMRAAGTGGGARVEVEGMVLLHPLFMGTAPLPSEGTDPTIPARSESIWRCLCAGKYGIDHPFSNPLALPPEAWAALGCRRVLVTTAELDRARDRGRTYVEAVRASAWGGEEAALYETDGEEHLYYLRQHGARTSSVAAEKAASEMAAVASFINRGNIRSTL